MKYIYVLLDPRKPGSFSYSGLNCSFLYEPFYVGMGLMDSDRHKAHHYEAINSDHNSPKLNKIRKILTQHDNYYFLTIRENVDFTEARQAEIDVISIIKRKDRGGPLTNLTCGGDGGVCNGESIPFTSDRWADSVRYSIARSLSGTTQSQETCDKRSKSLMGNNNRSRSGIDNGMFGVQRFGTDNPNGKYAYVCISPENEVFVAHQGELNIKLKEINTLYNGNVVSKWVACDRAEFYKTKKIVKKSSSNWSFLYSDNLKDYAMDNQQPSLLTAGEDVILWGNEGSTAIPKGSTLKRVEMGDILIRGW